MPLRRFDDVLRFVVLQEFLQRVSFSAQLHDPLEDGQAGRSVEVFGIVPHHAVLRRTEYALTVEQRAFIDAHLIPVGMVGEEGTPVHLLRIVCEVNVRVPAVSVVQVDDFGLLGGGYRGVGGNIFVAQESEGVAAFVADRVAEPVGVVSFRRDKRNHGP